VPQAIGQHYAIGSPDGIAGLEGAANGVARTEISGGSYVHANHPLANDGIIENPESAFARSSTFVRQDRAESLIVDARDQDAIERLLMDEEAPISRSPLNGFMTFGGTSISCSVPPVMHVTPGPPHESDWIPVGF
jgi:hypothetical protein